LRATLGANFWWCRPIDVTLGYVEDDLCFLLPCSTYLSSDLLIVPHRVKTVTASRAFCVAVPTIWNNLPDFSKVADSFNVVRRRLKCHLFDAVFKQPSFPTESLFRRFTNNRIRRLKSITLYCIVLVSLLPRVWIRKTTMNAGRYVSRIDVSGRNVTWSKRLQLND